MQFPLTLTNILVSLPINNSSSSSSEPTTMTDNGTKRTLRYISEDNPSPRSKANNGRRQTHSISRRPQPTRPRTLTKCRGTPSGALVVESTTYNSGRGGSIPDQGRKLFPSFPVVLYCSFFCDSAPMSSAPARAERGKFSFSITGFSNRRLVLEVVGRTRLYYACGSNADVATLAIRHPYS